MSIFNQFINFMYCKDILCILKISLVLPISTTITRPHILSNLLWTLPQLLKWQAYILYWLSLKSFSHCSGSNLKEKQIFSFHPFPTIPLHPQTKKRIQSKLEFISTSIYPYIHKDPHNSFMIKELASKNLPTSQPAQYQCSMF